MKIAVFSDIHSNGYAFTAVKRDMEDVQFTEKWFLGDLFGYGPNAVKVFNELQELSPEVWLAGNHDLGLAGISPFAGLGNADTRITWEYNRINLKKEMIDIVSNKPICRQRCIEGISCQLTHGFPGETDLEFVTNYDYAQAPLRSNHTIHDSDLVEIWKKNTPDFHFWLVGHSHFRTGWIWDGYRWKYLSKRDVFGTKLNGDNPENKVRSRSFTVTKKSLNQNTFLILNPGSVGMPAIGFGDSKYIRYANYLILASTDSTITIEYRSVPYNAKELKDIWSPYPKSVREKIRLA
jgi:predicted phosphodiesterase